MRIDAAGEDSVGTLDMLRPYYWAAWLTLLLGLSLTFFAWRSSVSYVNTLAEQRFAASVGEAQAALNAHLVAHAQALRGAQAYVGAMGQPSRDDWKRMYDTLRFGENYPGFNGIGYMQTFTLKERGRVLGALKQSYPNFTIQPPGDRNRYVALSAYEPVTTETQKVIGIDAWVDPERRKTLEAARDSGETRITGKVTLATDKTEDRRPGFLMYQAVYRHGLLLDTIEQRRKNLIGFVVAPFRIGVLAGQIYYAKHADIAMRIYDGNEATESTLFHATHPTLDFASAAHQRVLPIEVGGKTWQVHYASLPVFGSASDLAQPWRLLAGGVLISFLLFGTVWSLVATRARAIRMAQRMTRSLSDKETKLRALFAQAPLAIWTLDENGRVLECNDKLTQHMGATREKIIGFSMLTDAKDQSLVESIKRAIAGETIMLEGPYTSTTGNLRSIYQFYFQPVQVDGKFAFLLAFAQDISARKAAEAHIEHMAHHDALTGLANRLLLKDRLDHAIANAQRNMRTQALLFIDLDHFKTINDTVGHSVGDALLLEVSQRLRECVRESDTLARIGGDEFVILLTNLVSSNDCERVAEKLIATLAQPITVEQHTFSITASVGIAIWPTDGVDTETLTRNADVAMYHAKNSGRNNYQFFTHDMNAHVIEGLAMEVALRNALNNNEFLLQFQAQIDFESGLIIGAESLLRWQHPTLGLLPPSKFIPIAEERGLIDELGDWVLHQACRHARAWQLAGVPLVPIAVNISALQFREGSLHDSVVSALKESGLPPEYLVLEVTENAVMEHMDQAISALSKLCEMGITIGINDCGTGYSALSYLRRLPIHRLKIDQALVHDIQADKGDSGNINAVVSMAKNLKLEVVADGVETAYQAAFLRENGCLIMQGHFFVRPQFSDEFGVTLAKQIIYIDSF